MTSFLLRMQMFSITYSTHDKPKQRLAFGHSPSTFQNRRNAKMMTSFEGFPVFVVSCPELALLGAGAFNTGALDDELWDIYIPEIPKSYRNRDVLIIGDFIAQNLEEDHIVAILHHEVAHHRLGHLALAAEKMTAGAVDNVHMELEADAYAADRVGKATLLCALRALATQIAIVVARNTKKTLAETMEMFSENDDFTMRLKALK